MQGVLFPKVHYLPKLRPNKNVQLGLFDDDQEIGSAAIFPRLGLDASLMKNPLL